MDDRAASSISVIDPIGPSVNRVKQILFKPFDMEKWFVIGFCAWLALLCDGGGGGGGNFHFDGPSRGEMQEAKNVFMENLAWVLPVFVIGLAIGLTLAVLFLWLSSRGTFMFLHCVATNRGEVKVPWHKYRQQGNSLFMFRLVVWIISSVCFIPLIAAMVFLIFIGAERDFANPVFIIIGIALVVFLMILFGLFFGLLNKFTKDFVVPIMYLGTSRCVDGWRKFLSILSVNKARFLLYILFQFVIGLVIGGIVFALGLFTCGCACCLMAIPYLGTVLLLPILIFERSYSVYYLGQYGKDLEVFAPLTVTDKGEVLFEG